MEQTQSPWEANYIEAGFACFPLRQNKKKPAIPTWQAYQNRKPSEDEIARWADEYRGCNVGNVTGAISGIVVLDIDSPQAEQLARKLHGGPLPFTVEAKTPRGRHLYFRHPGFTVANIAGSDIEGAKLPKGLDLRGDGGYVVAPGSYYIPTDAERGEGKVEGPYTWREGHEPGGLVAFADMPEWLLAAVQHTAGAEKVCAPVAGAAGLPAPEPLGSLLRDAERHPYAAAALAKECEAVASAPEGSRNAQLNASAFSIGQLVAGSHIDEAEARDALATAASAAGLDRAEIRATIRSGFQAGMRQPRDIPDAPPPALPSGVWRASDGTLMEGRNDPIPYRDPVAVQAAYRAAEFATLKTAADLTAMVVPDREYLIDGWLPVGCVTTLFGDGGTGKSLVGMGMAAAVAAGKPLWDCETTKVPVLALYCEDDENELARRQQAITRSLDLTAGDLRECFIQSRFGRDSSLAHFQREGVKPSDLFSAIEEKAQAIGARLVIIDNINMVFLGDGNDAGQVTRFMAMLNRLALSIGGAVLLLGHTAKGEGSRYAGSTAWSNASRNRLFFSRPDNQSIAAKNPDMRQLTIDKSNYGKTGETLDLLWHYGAFVLPSEVDQEAKVTQQQLLDEQVFLQHLAEVTAQQQVVTTNHRARNFAPKVFAERMRGTIRYRTRGDFERAMGRLLSRGVIEDGHDLGWRTEQRKPATGLARTVLETATVNDVIARSPAEDILAKAGLRVPREQRS